MNALQLSFKINFNIINMTQPISIPNLDLFHYRKSRTNGIYENINSHTDKFIHPELPIRSSKYQYPSPSSYPYETQRPFLQAPMIMPQGFYQYVKAPSTYLDYAEDYLATGKLRRPEGIPEKTTGRFHSTSHHNTSYMGGQKQCSCQLTRQVSKDVTKDAYTKKQFYKTPTTTYNNNAYTKKQFHKVETSNSNYTSPIKKIQNKPEKSVYRKEIVQPSQPNKSPYMDINSEREEKYHTEIHKQQINRKGENNQKSSLGGVFDSLLNPNKITENESIMEESHVKKEQVNKQTVNLSINIQNPKNEQISKETQTANADTVNRSSVLLSKLFRKIPNILDEQTFKKMVRQQTQEFNNIKIEFDDDALAIDFDDLIETKDQYMQFSKDLLLRLNQLAGDKNELFLVGKLFEEKKKKGILWPEI